MPTLPYPTIIPPTKPHTPTNLKPTPFYSRENFPSLSAEEIQKLAQHRPATFHAASQISGVTPHSLVYLFNYVTKKGKAERAAARERAAGGDRSGEIVTHHFQEIEEQESENGVVAGELAATAEARGQQSAAGASAGGN